MGFFSNLTGPKQSKENKHKTQQKIALNEDTTKDVYDLANCGIYTLPENFSYYQIDLHLKTGLNLSKNKLSSLKEGGKYTDLAEISLLDLSFNLFKTLDDSLLTNLPRLTVLNLQENGFKTLPASLSSLKNLQSLNVSFNLLQSLPNTVGDLKYLQSLNLRGNSNLSVLPNSLGKIGATLSELGLEPDGFSSPPADVIRQGTESAVRWLADKGGYQYDTEVKVPQFLNQPLTKSTPVIDDSDQTAIDKYLKNLEAENDKQLQIAALAIEKDNQELEKLTREIETIAEAQQKDALKAIEDDENQAQKLALQAAREREKILADATNAIEQEQQNANKLITQLLEEQEIEIPNFLEKVRIIEENDAKLVASMQNDEGLNVDFKSIIEADLKENAEMARYFNDYMDEIEFASQNVLSQLAADDQFAKNEALKAEKDQAAMAATALEQLANDEKMQEEILTAAIKSRDTEMLRIESDIAQIEKQLKMMTMTDINERDLMVKDVMNAERLELAKMIQLLHKQLDDREEEIKSILSHIEKSDKDERLNYWLHMYREIMAQKPAELIHLEAKIGQIVRDVLMTADCDNYLSLFARHSILEESDLRFLSNERLKSMGVWSIGEQNRIMAAITKYVVPHAVTTEFENPTAPQNDDNPKDKFDTNKLKTVEQLPPVTYNPPTLGTNTTTTTSTTLSTNQTNNHPSSTSKKSTTEAPSAPTEVDLYEEAECVICLDKEPNVIFLPCGHACSCFDCCGNLNECPLCRVTIVNKIKMKRG